MRKLLLVFTAVLLFTLSGGCTSGSPTPNSLDTRPADLKIVYKWQEGSLPPPYHYEYTITIDSAGQGQIVMVPDYSFSNPPTWTETFALTTAARDRLYRLLIDKGLFTQRWQAQTDPPVGGSYDSLRVTAHGQQIDIPSFVVPSQATVAEDMTAAVRALVPDTIWYKLDTQREQYMAEHAK